MAQTSENSHGGHRTYHNPLEQDTLFTTPASFMLDARLTPLERKWLAGAALL